MFVAIGVGAIASIILYSALATSCEALSMIFDIIISTILMIGLLSYLVIASPPPERS
jgi:hypothetical protein